MNSSPWKSPSPTTLLATIARTPADMLAGRQAEIHAARDRKLEEARRLRQQRRQRVA
ncbi:MAG: hypothetical protein ABSD56_07910 [Bryobacteraceae bacterium]